MWQRIQIFVDSKKTWIKTYAWTKSLQPMLLRLLAKGWSKKVEATGDLVRNKTSENIRLLQRIFTKIKKVCANTRTIK